MNNTYLFLWLKSPELLLKGIKESSSRKKFVSLSFFKVFSNLRERFGSECLLFENVLKDGLLGMYFSIDLDLQEAGLLDLDLSF